MGNISQLVEAQGGSFESVYINIIGKLGLKASSRCADDFIGFQVLYLDFIN